MQEENVEASARSSEAEHAVTEDLKEFLPLGMRIAAAWSWRLIAVGLALAGFLWLIVQVRIIVIPLFVAILLTALLSPLVRWFEKIGAPRWLGVVASLATLVAAVWILITLIVTQMNRGLSDLAQHSTAAWNDLLNWFEHNSLGISAQQLSEITQQIGVTIEKHQSEIWSGALGVATTAGQFVTGLLLAIFSLIFLLLDGKRIWFWVLGFLPEKAHAPVYSAGLSGWVSVGQYVRVQIFVAFVDGAGIGIGAALLGVPLPVPIAILVFLGSFIPFLGAITTGLLAAFIALVYNGPVIALFMLGVVILVNQIEGHVLQPLVMGNAVRVHPLGVVLAVSTGALLAGVPGALFAVPLVASMNAIVNTLVEKQWDSNRNPVTEYRKHERVKHQAKHRAKAVARTQSKENSS